MRIARYIIIVATVVLVAAVADRSFRRGSPFAGGDPVTSIVVEVRADRPAGQARVALLPAAADSLRLFLARGRWERAGDSFPTGDVTVSLHGETGRVGMLYISRELVLGVGAGGEPRLKRISDSERAMLDWVVR